MLLNLQETCYQDIMIIISKEDIKNEYYPQQINNLFHKLKSQFKKIEKEVKVPSPPQDWKNKLVLAQLIYKMYKNKQCNKQKKMCRVWNSRLRNKNIPKRLWKKLGEVLKSMECLVMINWKKLKRPLKKWIYN